MKPSFSLQGLLTGLVLMVTGCTSDPALVSKGKTPPPLPLEQPLTPRLELVEKVARFERIITDLAYDGKEIWASIYHTRGRFLRFDPGKRRWKEITIDFGPRTDRAIREIGDQG